MSDFCCGHVAMSDIEAFPSNRPKRFYISPWEKGLFLLKKRKGEVCLKLTCQFLELAGEALQPLQHHVVATSRPSWSGSRQVVEHDLKGFIPWFHAEGHWVIAETNG